MKLISLSPHPEALANYLRHRFDIRFETGFRTALNLPEVPDRFEALTVWCSKALARYKPLGLVARIERIEVDLSHCLRNTGLLGNRSDCSPTPVQVIAKLWDSTHGLSVLRLPQQRPEAALQNGDTSSPRTFREARHEQT